MQRKNIVSSDDPVEYNTNGNPTTTFTASERKTIDKALSILERHYKPGQQITSPADTKNFFTLKYAGLEDEVFGVLFLTNHHSVISFEIMFRGTIDSCTVHKRNVVKRALELNAAAVIFSHNHPSGYAEPSHADRAITRALTDALALIDVRVLDHIVVGGSNTVSFADRGWI